MKKTLVYSIAAVTIGLVVVLLPIATLARTRFGQDSASMATSSSLKELDGSRAGTSLVSVEPPLELQLLAVCFVIVFIIYALVKRRMTPHDYGWARLPPL